MTSLISTCVPVVVSAILQILVVHSQSQAWAAQSCQSVNELWSSYSLRPRPIEAVSGECHSATLRDCSSSSATEETCQASSASIRQGPLADSDVLSEQLDTHHKCRYHTWRRSSDVNITLAFKSPIELKAAVLYFYNIPSRGIGLPDNIEIYSNQSDHFIRSERKIIGRETLQQSDSRRRNVTIEITENPLVSSMSFRIRLMITSSSLIDQLILSEAILCTLPDMDDTPTIEPILILLGNPRPTDPVVTLGPSNTVSDFNLSCAIGLEGSYVWEWHAPLSVDGLQLLVITSSDTRSSILQISQISTTRGYAGEYECIVSAMPDVRLTRSFTLNLLSNLTAEQSLVEVVPGQKFVALSCELLGYVSDDIPEIQWHFRDIRISNTSSQFMISVTNGTNAIQNGGVNVRPSVRSTLTVNLSKSIFQRGSRNINFICQMGTVTQSIDVRKVGAEISTMIIAAIVPVFGVTLLIIIVIIIIVSCLYWRGKRTESTKHPQDDSVDCNMKRDIGKSDSTNEPFYQEVSNPAKPPPPPIPLRFPSLRYSGEYAVIGESVLGAHDGHFEMVNSNVHYQEVAPKALKLPTKQLDFLQDNRVCNSTHEIDQIIIEHKENQLSHAY